MRRPSNGSTSCMARRLEHDQHRSSFPQLVPSPSSGLDRMLSGFDRAPSGLDRVLSGHDQPGSHLSPLQPKLNWPDVLVAGLAVSGQYIRFGKPCPHPGWNPASNSELGGIKKKFLGSNGGGSSELRLGLGPQSWVEVVVPPDQPSCRNSTPQK